MTAADTGACHVKFCDEAAGHELPHRAYLGEITLAPPQTAHHVAVAVIGTSAGPAGVELTVGTSRQHYAAALLDWRSTNELAGLLLAARKRYARDGG